MNSRRPGRARAAPLILMKRGTRGAARGRQFLVSSESGLLGNPRQLLHRDRDLLRIARGVQNQGVGHGRGRQSVQPRVGWLYRYGHGSAGHGCRARSERQPRARCVWAET